MQRILKFAGVGIAATIADFLLYELALHTVFQGNLTASAIAAGVGATFVAYIGHSKITWKTRDPGKWGIVKFFLWNAFMVALVRPILVWFFDLLTGLYEFGLWLCQAIHLPFDYEFVESTGVYILMTIVTLVLNYLFYGRVVFSKEKVGGEKVDVKSVRKAGKEEKAKTVSEKKRR